MAIVYWTSLLIGGALLLPSLLLGDLEVEADVDVDVDVDADIEAEADSGDGDGGFAWLSVRFWVFFATFFGLTGVALSVAGLGPELTALVAVGDGLVASLAVSHVVGRLKRQKVSSSVRSIDLVGERGTVLLPLGPNTTGKVRLSLKGRDLEVFATNTSEPTPIGARVRVSQVADDGSVRVSRVNS